MIKNYKLTTRLALVVTCLMMVFSINVNAQLTGVKNIPGDYATIVAAVADLNTQGVGASGVTFDIIAGYTETITAPISVTATGTSSNPIIFRRNGAGANPIITAYIGTGTPGSAVQDGIWNLVGSDYVSILNIDLVDPNTTNPATMEYGFGFFKASAINGCQNNLIQGCTVTLSRNNNAAGSGPSVEGSKGISVENSTIAAQGTALAITNATGANSFNKFYNNTIQNCNYGVVIIGFADVTPFSNADMNNEIGGSVTTGNTIQNFGGGAATSPSAGIRTLAQYNLQVTSNTVNNNTGTGVNHATTLRGIYINTAASANANITYNTVTVNSAATTSLLEGIDNASGSTAAGNTVNITNNLIQNCTYSTATSGAFIALVNSGSAATINLNNNTVSNNILSGTGTFTGIDGGASSVNNMFLNNNTVVNNTKIGASGSFYCIRSSTALVTVNGNIINNNSFSASSGASSASLYGYYNFGSPTSETYTNNSITNLTISGSSTSTASLIFGIYSNTTAASNKSISNNQINSLQFNNSSTGAASVCGINQFLGSTINISKNKIYNLLSSGGTSTVSGIIINSGTTITASNNIIGDLKTPSANAANPLNAINVLGGTTANLYYNTIRLFETSSGTNFGSSAISVSATPTVDIRNNIIINASTANGTGFTVAYRRSSATLTTYAGTSNNNDFFAGTPGVSNLIFYDGTNSDQTLAAFQTRVASRDNNSLSVNPNFLSSTGSAPDFLHIDPSISTGLESGGATIAGITTDYDNETRPGPTAVNGGGSAPDIGADEFDGIPSFTCAAPTPGNTMATNATICFAGSTTLSLQNATAGTGVTYQWQSSPDNSIYTNIAGASSATYVVSPTAATYYQAVVTCANGPATATSAPIQITFTNSVTGTTPGSRCGTGTVSLAATGSAGTTLNWYAAATGGSAIGTGSPFTTPSISATTTYYVGAEASSPGTVITASGSGTNTTSTYPAAYGSYWGNVHSQYLITATDLAALNLRAGNITSMSFDVTALGSPVALTGYTIQMANTSATGLAAFDPTVGTVVYGPTNYSPVIGSFASNTHVFSTAFNWDGTSNVLIDICFNNGVTGSTNTLTKMTATSYVSSVYYGVDGVIAGGVCGNTTVTGTASNRPNIMFNGQVVCSSPRSSVDATVGASPIVTVSTAQTVCNDAVVQMDVTSSISDYDTYIWSPTANLYTDAAGTIAYTGTSETTIYARTTTAGASIYTLNASNSITACAAVATSTVTVLPATATVSASPSSICGSGTTTLSISPSTGYGAGSVQWQTSSDNSLFTDIIGATAVTYTTPTISSTTYYKAIIKNGAGIACTSTPSITITVNSPAITGTTPAARCGTGTVTLDATGNAGTSLSWYTAATGGSAIATGPSFTTPTISSTTTYFVDAGISGGSANITIGSGASATVSTGSGDDFISPFGHYWGGLKGQFLVKASELSAAGISAGNITSITFDVVSGGTLYQGFNMSIGATAATALTTTAISGLTNVYTTTSPAGLTTPASGPLTINFTSPFTWDGSSNIVIETCWTNNNGGGTGTTVKYDATSFVSHNYFRADNSTTICAATAMTGTKSSRPKMTFGATPVCSSARTAVIATVNTPPAVALTATPSTICAGQSSVLDVTSSNPDYSYTWEPGTLSGSTQTVSPSSTTTYSLSAVDASGGTNDGCATIATITLNVTPLPVLPTVTATPASICFGGSSQLNAATPAQAYCTPAMSSASASGDYLKSFTFANISNLNTVDAATDYTYYNALTANVVAGTPNSLTLEAGGTSSTYAMQFRIWIDYNQNGIFEASESAYNTTTSSFSPTVVSGSVTVPASAYNGVTRMRVMAKYNSTPLVTESCLGTSTFGEYEDYNVSITGGTNLPSYSWSPSTFLNDPAISNPLASAMTTTTTYTVNVTASGCSASQAVTVTVNPLPIVTANATATTVCAGTSVTLTGGGATSYVWDNSVTDGVAFTPSGTLTYMVTGTDGNGCTNTATTTVTVNPMPSAPVASGTTICAGTTATLTATGTGTIGWYDAATLGTHVGSGTSFTTPVLTSDATYYVQDSSAAGCASSRTSVTLTVNPLPTVTANATATTVCAGTSVTLTGGGATSYVWDNSVTDGVPFTPSGTLTYMVTGTDGNGCTNTATTTVTVNPMPSTPVASGTTICAGTTATLTTTGTGTIGWYDAATLGTHVGSGASFATPVLTSDATYYVQDSSAAGCVSSRTAVTVTVNPLPTVTANATATTVCSGTAVTLTGGGATSYVWDNSVIDGTPFTPTTTATYNVVGTDANSCSNTASITITVNSVTVDLGTDIVQCGGTVTLDAGNAGLDFVWSDASTGQTLTVTASATYSVTVTDLATSCSATDAIDVTINTIPTVSLTPFATSVCDNGGPITLSGGSPTGGVYSGTGVTGSNFDPAVSGAGMFLITYTITDGTTSCSNSDTASITVDLCSGIAKDNSGFQGISVYPNPTSGIVKINISKTNFSQLTISILDIQGKEVYNETDKNIATEYNKEINLEKLAKGIYYIKLNTGNDSKVQKLIVH